jgi:flagellar protein FlaF
MPRSPLDAYRSAEKAAVSGRELEATALFKSARQLEAVQRSWDAPDRATRLDEALRYNTRLWTFFQSELADADHPMPVELRRNLLELSRFIDKRTFEVLAFPEPAKLQVLININRQIAMGLSQKIEAEVQVAAAG